MNHISLIPEEFFLKVDTNGVLINDPRVLYVLKKTWSNENLEDNALALVLAHVHPEMYNLISFMSYDEMLKTMMLSTELSSEFKKVLESLLAFGQIDLNDVNRIENVEEQIYFSFALKMMSPSLLFDFDMNQYLSYLLKIEQEQNILYQMGFETNREHER